MTGQIMHEYYSDLVYRNNHFNTKRYKLSINDPPEDATNHTNGQNH
jgi:hypothetical protein